MPLPSWPHLVDDDGTGRTGTIFNEAWAELLRVSIETWVISGTNPTKSVADLIDDWVTSWGTKTSLTARLAVSLEDDGTLKPQANLTTTAQSGELQGQGPVIKNGAFTQWSLGTAVAPDFWVLSGAGAAVVRTGVGESDTQETQTGGYAVKITYGSAAAKLTQGVITSGLFSHFGNEGTKKIAFAVHCKAAVASQASIVVDDGIGITRGGTSGNNTYHVGDSSNDLLYGVHTVNVGATKLDVYLEVAQSGAAYFGGVQLMYSPVAYSRFVPIIGARGGEIFNRSDTKGNVNAATTVLHGFDFVSVRFFDQPQRELCYESWGTTTNNANLKRLAFKYGANVAMQFDLPTAEDGYWHFQSRVIFTGPAAQQILSVLFYGKQDHTTGNVRLFQTNLTEAGNILAVATTGLGAVTDDMKANHSRAWVETVY